MWKNESAHALIEVPFNQPAMTGLRRAQPHCITLTCRRPPSPAVHSCQLLPLRYPPVHPIADLDQRQVGVHIPATAQVVSQDGDARRAQGHLQEGCVSRGRVPAARHERVPVDRRQARGLLCLHLCPQPLDARPQHLLHVPPPVLLPVRATCCVLRAVLCRAVLCNAPAHVRACRARLTPHPCPCCALCAVCDAGSLFPQAPGEPRGPAAGAVRRAL